MGGVGNKNTEASAELETFFTGRSRVPENQISWDTGRETGLLQGEVLGDRAHRFGRNQASLVLQLME